MNDQAQIELLLREHYASLCAMSAGLIGELSAAEDIVQETIIRFWEKRNQWKDIQSPEDYLFIMVRNNSLSYLRKLQRLNKRIEQLPPAETTEQSFLYQIMEQELNALLLKAINRLSPQRAQVMEHVLSGYDNQEIASLLGISIHTVKSLKYASIRQLREILGREELLLLTIILST